MHWALNTYLRAVLSEPKARQGQPEDYEPKAAGHCSSAATEGAQVAVAGAARAATLATAAATAAAVVADSAAVDDAPAAGGGSVEVTAMEAATPPLSAITPERQQQPQEQQQQQQQQQQDEEEAAMDCAEPASPSLTGALSVPLLEEVLRHLDHRSLCLATRASKALSKVRHPHGCELAQAAMHAPGQAPWRRAIHVHLRAFVH